MTGWDEPDADPVGDLLKLAEALKNPFPTPFVLPRNLERHIDPEVLSQAVAAGEVVVQD